MNEPGYVRLARSGELADRVARARELSSRCGLCPRRCGVDRTAGETGYCEAGPLARVYSHMSHPGEEPPISGERGSGTIFLSHCTMSCVYCQNYRFSSLNEGADLTARELASVATELSDAGCHNLNFVSPTHFMPQILEALSLAARDGVKMPVVWNTSGYEVAEALEILDGVVDIYLSDLRYVDSGSALAYSDAPDYPAAASSALVEMRRQVGPLETGEDGTAVRGLIVRHLVLPGRASGTASAMRFVADRLGRDTSVSLMSQYYPTHRAKLHPAIARRISRDEWEEATRALADAGLTNGWVQAFHDEVSPMAGTELAPGGG